MPRIDPIQLLNCLSVLLSPNGGIKSRDEVERLANLMTKFSKKLVSKCIYIQILKCTETELLGLFMGSGGWRLVHMWLTESIVAKNWPLVRELLELLLLCPVDIERLKTNNCPKLIKELSKDGNHFAIRALASKLVEQWLKTVKGEHVIPIRVTDIPQIVSHAFSEINSDIILKNEGEISEIRVKDLNETESKNSVKDNIKLENPSEPIISKTESNNSDSKIKEEIEKEQETLPVLKITLKDGKQIISQVDDSDDSKLSEKSDKEKTKDKHKNKNKDNTHDKTSSNSRSSSSKRSSKSHSSSNDKIKSSHKSSSSPSRHNKERTRDKDKHSHNTKSKQSSDSSSRKSNSKSSSSSSRSKEDRNLKQSSDKAKSKDKSKDDKNDKKDLHKSEDKSQPLSIHKLGKIPKLSDVKKEKPSISIEVRKPDEPKPKTVKTFNSKFRKHGLEEEVKPPPSRASLLNKKVPPVPPTVSIPKRPSPVHNETPPEKKPKTTEHVEKAGAIKLIPPKPKREQYYRDHLMLRSDYNCLGSFFSCGKSKTYNLMGSKVFPLSVKYWLQINAGLIQYKSFVEY